MKIAPELKVTAYNRFAGRLAQEGKQHPLYQRRELRKLQDLDARPEERGGGGGGGTVMGEGSLRAHPKA